MERTASVAASVAATLARIEEHGGDAVAALHAGGVHLDDEPEAMADLAVHLQGAITRAARAAPGHLTLYTELLAQAIAGGFEAGRHYERSLSEVTAAHR